MPRTNEWIANGAALGRKRTLINRFAVKRSTIKGETEMRHHAMTTLACTVVCGVAYLLGAPSYAAEYIKGTWQEDRSFSPAVVTEGGNIIWLAGSGGTTGPDGELITDFDQQVHQTFRNLEATLERAGGTLQDIVTMTVFISDVRHGDEFVRIRAEYFRDGYPGSALLTVAGFAVPELLVEIQAIAVVGEAN